MVGCGYGEALRDPFRVSSGLIVVDLRLSGAIKCNPLPPLSFGHGSRPSVPQHPAQHKRRLDHELPGDTLARIKIEDEHVGMLDIVDARIPGVQLDRADLDEAEEAVEVIDPEPRAFAPFALFDRERVNCLRDRRQLSLVIEGRASDVAHELERPAPEMRKGPLPDLFQYAASSSFEGGTASGRSCRMFSRGTPV